MFKRDPDGPPAYANDVVQHQGNYGMKQSAPATTWGGPSTSTGQNLYAIVILSETDKLRLMGFSPEVLNMINSTVSRAWPQIQRQGKNGWGAHEIKLAGNPWRGSSSEAVPSKRLMIHILHDLSAAGWHLAASVDMSKKSYDKDTLFFRAGPPIVRQFFAVTFNEYDKVRLIDWPNEMVKQAFMNAISTWPSGIQDQKEKEHGCYQFKLRGNPWYTSQGSQVGAARLLACALLSAMDHAGYELAGTIDMNVGAEGADMDSWFFASKL